VAALHAHRPTYEAAVAAVVLQPFTAPCEYLCLCIE
jgi:hypothetical protein